MVCIAHLCRYGTLSEGKRSYTIVIYVAKQSGFYNTFIRSINPTVSVTTSDSQSGHTETVSISTTGTVASAKKYSASASISVRNSRNSNFTLESNSKGNSGNISLDANFGSATISNPAPASPYKASVYSISPAVSQLGNSS